MKTKMKTKYRVIEEVKHSPKTLSAMKEAAAVLAAVKAAGLDLEHPDTKAGFNKMIARLSESIGCYHHDAAVRTAEVRIATKGTLKKTAYHKICRVFRNEHIEPTGHILKRINNLKDKGKENIYSLLTKTCFRATIPRPDDAVLTAAGLSSKMPKEYYTLTEGYEHVYENPFARYIVTGLIEKLEINTFTAS